MFLLQNFLMDLIALAGVNYFLRRHRKYRDLILTAGLASLLGLLLLLAVKNDLLYTLLAHFVLNSAMVLVCFGIRGGKRAFLENWAVTYLVVILLGGFTGWLRGSGLLPAGAVPAALAGMLGLFLILFYLMQRKSFGNHIYEVQLKKDVREICLNAYWDSGNQLKDPYTGQGVSILSHARAKEFLDGTKDQIRLVPYRSLGEREGLIRVTDVDELILHDGKERVRISHAAIGIADPGLLEPKEYDLILHASCLQ